MLADLANLPARATLPDLADAPPCARTYIATHATEPPPNQVIHTDQSTSALVRLVRRRDASAAGAKKPAASKPAAGAKRQAVEPAAADDERPAKKQAAEAAPGVRGATLVTFSAEELRAKTIPQLKELLKARSLPVSGAKDELIRRLVDHARAVKYPTTK